MQCIWIHPNSKHIGYTKEEIENLTFIPLILVSASDVNRDEKTYGWKYIQGAGDDHQSWSRGLTPELFYKYEKEILEDTSIIEEIVDKDQQSDIHTLFNHSNQIYKIGDTNLFIGSFQSNFPEEMIKIFCKKGENQKDCFYFDIIDNKKSKSLEINLPSLFDLVKSLLEKNKKILILCPTGLSESICVCMSILISFYDKNNIYGKCEKVSKDYIKEKFIFISTFIPKASPSRFLMKQLNRYYLNVK